MASLARRCNPRLLATISLMLFAGMMGGYVFNVMDLHGSMKKLGLISQADFELDKLSPGKPKHHHDTALVSRSKSPPQTEAPVQIKVVEKVKVIEKMIYQSAGPPGVLFRFWGQFLLWDFYRLPSYGPDVPEHTDKYLVYRCDKGGMQVCGGWADRLKGMVISYLIANLTGRAFKAHISNPDCELTDYLLPNRVNWSFPSKDMPKNKTSWKVYRHIDDHRFKNTMKNKNFDDEFDQELKYVYFMANLENVSGLKKNLNYSSRLSWMKDITPADVYAAIYKRLFVLHPRLQSQLQKIMYTTLKTPKHRLICVHVRMGRTKSIPDDSEVRNNMTNLPKIVEFIKKHSKSDLDRVFVMSDSIKVINAMFNETSFRDRLVTVPGEIVHVDKQSDHKTEEMCSGFEKLLLEHHLLMNCDVMVRGHSGLSVIASAIRGTDKDLYCLMRNGTITPCVRNDFSTFL